MKIKEIHVMISYPYQLAPYMYGRVELTELIEIDGTENPEGIKTETAMKLISQCKDISHTIVVGENKSVEHEQKPSDSSQRRRRRF